MRNRFKDLTSLFVVLFLASCMSKPVRPVQSSNDITGKTWKLIEIGGQPIQLSDPKNNPYFVLNKGAMSYEGHGGCNGIGGDVVISPEAMRITFKQGMSTMIACDDLATEKAFTEAMITADNYSVNGNTLTLNKGRMAPLAKFVLQK